MFFRNDIILIIHFMQSIAIFFCYVFYAILSMKRENNSFEIFFIYYVAYTVSLWAHFDSSVILSTTN